MSKNWLKNLIFEDSGTEEQSANGLQEPINSYTPNIRAEHIQAAINTPPPLPNDYIRENITGTVDTNLMNKLCAVMDAQVFEGFDYLKFKRSVESLESIQPDEVIRFTTAFVSLNAVDSSYSHSSLLQSVDKYIDLIENERLVGMNQLANLRENKVDTKAKELDNAVEKFNKMKEEMALLSDFIAKTSQEINDQKSEYLLQEANFKSTVDFIVNQLKKDKMKIETILSQ